MSDDPTPEPRPEARRAWRWRWIGALTAIAWVPWVLGQAARDRGWLTGLCFYIPSPALTGLGLAASLVHLLQRDRRAAAALGLMMIPPAVSVLFLENQWVRPVKERQFSATRFVHWNIAYGQRGKGQVEEELLRQRAEVYVLSEVPRPDSLRELAARLGSDYDSVRLGSMAFVARGRLVDARRLVNAGGLRVNRVSWQGEHGTLTLFGIDLASDLLVPRDPLLRQARTLMEQYRPDIVAGDFNAPRRSRALWPLPAGFSHAYLDAGRGWSYTWPVPCPLYAIDQCIVSSAVRPIRYELVSTPFSDHRMQVLEYRLEPSSR